MSSRNNDHPTRKDWLKLCYMGLYIVGLFWIIGSGVYHFIDLSFKESIEKVQDAKIEGDETQVQKESKEPSLTSLIVQPLAESKKAKVVFEHLGYLLLLLIFFLLAPIPLEHMKRFKLMNFEFEKETAEQDVAERITIQQNKFAFLIDWLREENIDKFLRITRLHTSYQDFLKEMLNEMMEYYRKDDIFFEYEIKTEDEFRKNHTTYPRVVRYSLDVAASLGSAIPINKENDRHIYFKNYMIHTIEVKENVYTDEEKFVTYVIILHSYRTTFDEYDGQLLAGITSLTYELYQKYHTLAAINDMN
ncbi:hypothetical protein ACQKL5_10660 [Peribacillus sp. NPDC097675]|uniref:hypothetical protein n=1 Tax=Peribacillus sp. NPDC097675 TaxID=3390618 RepID=UPI003CFC5950